MKIFLIAGFVLLGVATISEGQFRGTTCLYCAFDNEQGCFQVPDGLYQSCSECSRYIRCQGGQRTERNQCNNRYWFSTAEQKCKPPVNGCCGCYCEDPFKSTPTPETPQRTTTKAPTPPPQPIKCSSTGSHCITADSKSCAGLPDGDYQACEGCTYYHSCVAGYINYSFRPCPRTDWGGLRGQLIWQRVATNVYNNGTCERTSWSCAECNDAPTPTPTQPSSCYNTGSGCISASPSACRGLPDGDYQACEGCTFYHSCVAGYLNYAYRDCPLTNYQGLRGRLVWQRKSGVYNEGTCEYRSTTCTECINQPANPPPTVTPAPTAVPPPRPVPCYNTGSGCISASPSACRGLSDGDYQACEGCTFYHTCVAGYLNYARRDCPLTNYGGLRGKLVWQRKAGVYNEGTCEYSSTTCSECVSKPPEPVPTKATEKPTLAPTVVPDYRPCSSTGRNCIPNEASACKGLPDGDYQACEDCTIFYKCSNYAIYTFNCPLTNYGGLRGKLVWQQWTPNTGRCERTSTSCKECDQVYPRPPTGPTPPSPGLPTTTPKPDPEDPIWTPCASTGTGCLAGFAGACRGRADGHYQACEGCTIYHSCSGGVLYASRMCPLTFTGGLRGRLVWKQLTSTAGICDYTSNTCTECATKPINPTPAPQCTEFPRCVQAGADCREDGLPDGDYQICQSCFHYLSCQKGNTWRCRACPSYNDKPWQWRITSPTQGYCTNSSNTCNQCPLKSSNKVSQKEAFDIEARLLLLAMKRKSTCLYGNADSCSGQLDGDYQACESCSRYHSCSEGVTYANRRCPPGLFWQAAAVNKGSCEYTSTSCHKTKRWMIDENQGINY